MTTSIIGLDLSLTATGICTKHSGPWVYKSKLRGVERLADIRDHFRRHFSYWDVVVLEGYSMGGQRGSAGVGQMLGELGGVIRLDLHENNVPYVEVPPSVLKKFATGKGNAGKPDMLAAAIRHGYEGPNEDNCVDAWWLYQLGVYRYGAGLVIPDGVNDTAYRAEAVSKIDWPKEAA